MVTLQGLPNMGKNCFIFFSSMLQMISVMKDCKLNIIHHFANCKSCEQQLVTRRLVLNGKFSYPNKLLTVSLECLSFYLFFTDIKCYYYNCSLCRMSIRPVVSKARHWSNYSSGVSELSERYIICTCTLLN